MFKRLKNLWKLSSVNVIRSDEMMPEGAKSIHLVEGDGKALVLSDFTEDELAQYQHEQEQGWKRFYRKLRRWTNSKGSHSE